MFNGAMGKMAAGHWPVAVGRVILALAIMIGGGPVPAEAAVLKPVISGVTPNRDTTPTWTWTSGGGGVGTYRYRFHNTISAWGSTITTTTSFTQVTPLADGKYFIYVMEKDAAGNWSPYAFKSIVVDTTPPGAPAVSGTTPTKNSTPKWTWIAGGGNGTFRYSLDLDDMSGATETAAKSYIPSTALDEGEHTLYVQERDKAGNWSVSGSKTIVIDTTKPVMPVVSGATPTTITPTWSWVAGGGGNGTFRHILDSSTMAGATVTTATSYTPETALSAGSHTLYVQERDEAGNWSYKGVKAIEVLAPAVTLSLLPDTGQTASYTATFGEDSDYTINPPSYTVNGDGTVTDNVTGLIWQQEDDNVYRTWGDAMTYCDNLDLGLYADWRLLSKKELVGIVDLGRVSQAIDPAAFPGTNFQGYWSSTTYADGTVYAWVVYFDVGLVNYDYKNNIYYARCVRGGQ